MGSQVLTANHPIFIAGVFRSGTTLLRLMLNAHSRIAIPVESHFLSELIYDYPIDRELTESEINHIANLIVNHERFEHWQLSSTQLQTAVAAVDHVTLGGLIELLYQLEIGNSSLRWGDKTPGYERHFDRLAEVFPNAKFIHIHRDGRDVSNSMCDRNWNGITEFQRANYWRRSIDTALDSANKLGSTRCLNIQYEQLVRSPETTLRDICEFIGERYEPQMLRFSRDAIQNVVDQDIHSKLIRLPDPNKDLQRWRTESSKIRVLLFEALAERSLLAAGYQLSFGPVARKLTRLAYWIPGLTISKAHEVYLLTPTNFRSGLRRNGWVKKLRNMMYRRQPTQAEAKGV